MARMQTDADQVFLLACRLAEVQPTHRQWRKWCRGFGLAFKFREQAALKQRGQ